MATKPIPVRIPDEWLTRLDAAAARLGTNRARLIAFCAQTFAEDFAARGKAMMPPDWEKIFAAMDGRRKILPAVMLNDGPLVTSLPEPQPTSYKPNKKRKPK